MTALVTVTTACGHRSPAAPPSAAGPSYICCTAADIDPVRHAGDTVILHWTVKGTQAASRPAVTLRAALSGPYPTAAGLKADDQPAYTITAPPVRPTATVDEAPTSTLNIPTTARPGYYNLRFTVESLGASTSGSSVIEVR